MPQGDIENYLSDIIVIILIPDGGAAERDGKQPVISHHD
jgi:hypothetical protein